MIKADCIPFKSPLAKWNFSRDLCLTCNCLQYSKVCTSRVAEDVLQWAACPAVYERVMSKKYFEPFSDATNSCKNYQKIYCSVRSPSDGLLVALIKTEKRYLRRVVRSWSVISALPILIWDIRKKERNGYLKILITNSNIAGKWQP